jgi:hypothetical protein
MTEQTKQPWESDVEKEAANFFKAASYNFAFAMKTSLGFLPNPANPEYRRVQLDYFLDAVADFCATIFATYASHGEKMETVMVESIKMKFKNIREALDKKVITQDKTIVTPSGN